MNRWKMVDPLMRRQGEAVLRRLTESGHEAYFVGGCVRDELMGRPVHDMDIATSARPEEVIALFDRTVPTGLQHGTVTVIMDGYPYEVTTFRKESAYEDHRRPSSVEFVDALLEDLRRRDFTMNAIAADANGELTDPFGGQSDIASGIIRCVGRAKERFDEDALRMVRAIRFASVFGFKPVKSLWSAMRSGRTHIAYIATERIRIELEKMMLGPKPLRGLALLQRSGLLQYVKAPVPKTAFEAPENEIHDVRLQSIETCPPERPELRWSLLLQRLRVPGERAADLMKAWTFSNAASQRTSEIILFDESWSDITRGSDDPKALRKAWIGIQLRFGKEVAEGWIVREQRLLRTERERGDGSPNRDRLLQEAEKWHKEVPVHTLRELAIRGGDVIQHLGQKGGPWLSPLMDRLLLQVAAGELPNEREALLEQAKVVVNEHGTS